MYMCGLYMNHHPPLPGKLHMIIPNPNASHSLRSPNRLRERGSRSRHGKPKRAVRDGFTLIEILVVLAMIALLASLILAATGKARQSARSTLALSGIRQSGQHLLADAAENEGHIKLFIFGSTSTPGARDLMLIHIVGKRMGIDDIRNPLLSRIIRTPAWYEPPAGASLDTRSVWGINYRPNPDLGVEWSEVRFPAPHQDQKYHVLRTFQVSKPNLYPILADSSNAEGKPVFYMSRDPYNQDRGVFFAMRYDERGPIFKLDGSARMIGTDLMETYGFRIGYLFRPKNPATDPRRITIN